MSTVARFKQREHTRQGMLTHLQVDNPLGGILLTKTAEGWEWRYYGDVEVVDLVGAMEMVKHDLLTDYAEQAR